MVNKKNTKKTKLSDVRLSESQAHLKAIIETAVDAIITIDEAGLITSCNPATERLFGYSQQELVGYTINRLMPSPYRDEHDEYIRRYVKSGIKKIIGIGREVLGEKKDGTIFPIYLSVGEVRLGNLRLFTGIIRDITDLKKSEQKLREANEKLKEQFWIIEGRAKLADAIREELSVTEVAQKMLDFICDYLNIPVATLYVIENERLKRTATVAFYDLNAKSEFAIGETLLGQAAQQNKSITLHDLPDNYFSIASSLGSIKPRHLMIMPVASHNKVTGVFEFATLTPFIERDLEFLKIISETIAIGIKTAQSRRVHELLQETQQQALTLEQQRAELKFENERLEEHTKALEASESQLQMQQVELQQFNEELAAQTESLESQNKELEKAKQKLEINTKQLELAGKYKSEFLANMSHELRTPLNSIMILAKVLTENREGNLASSQKESLETIYESGSDLLNLINDILDLSKVEAGKLEIEFEKIELQSFLSSLIKKHKPLAEAKGLDFLVQSEGNICDYLYSDPKRVEQILKNLLSNAIKFTEKGFVKLLLREAHDALVFMVEDTGIGIKEENLSLIFEPFRQVDGSSSRKFSGSGLGLAISKQLAHLLDGRIEISSRFGYGCCFSLFLPNKKAPLNLEINTIKPIKHSTKPTTNSIVDFFGNRSVVIIACDNEISDRIFQIAKPRDISCHHTEDGFDGIELVSDLMPAAVILAINSSDLSEEQLFWQIKDNPKTRHIPIYIISHADIGKRMLIKGAASFLRKPISQDELISVFDHIEKIIETKHRNLLVIEDNSQQRNSIQQLVGNGDLHFIGVGTGEEGLVILRSEKPIHCIILDLSLPDMSGYELLRQLVAEKGEQIPPVIVYTGSSLELEEEIKLRQYSDSIIIKGVCSPERLLDEVMLFLHRNERSLATESREILTQLRNESLQGRKILLADDDMRNVYALSKVLKSNGLLVEIARNGIEAINKLQQLHPSIDLVLMDMMMPEMDGYEAMATVRRTPELKDLPLIALTAKAMKGDRNKCLSAGASDYIPKPIDVDRLLTLLRVWLTK